MCRSAAFFAFLIARIHPVDVGLHQPPMTQEDLAREINLMGMEITPLIISRIEKNQRHVCDGELKMLAKALGVTMEWLCSDDD